MSNENPNLSSAIKKTSSDSDEHESSVNLPKEMEEVLKDLPPESSDVVRGMVRALFMSRETTTISGGSPLAGKIDASHLSKLIENDDKEDERHHQRSQSAQTTNRIAIGAVLCLVIVVLAYAGITKKEQLAEKIIIAGISGIGGLGAGYAIGKSKE
jgi:hypothetical protein